MYQSHFADNTHGVTAYVGCMWWPGRHSLSYPQAWLEDRRHVTMADETLTHVCIAAHIPESIRQPSSCAICTKAMPVDNTDDCLPTPQAVHVCSEHVHIVGRHTYRTVFNVNRMRL